MNLSLILMFLQLMGICSIVNTQNDENNLTTRSPKHSSRPSSSTPGKKMKRPPPIHVRFDEKNSEKIKKLLQFDEEVSQNIEKFSLALFNQLSSDSKLTPVNFMMSPFSIYHLLTMITEGSNGSTLKQLQDVLKITQLEKTRDFEQYLNYYLSTTNTDAQVKKFALFINDRNRPVNNEFESIIEKSYGAIVEPVQFQNINETLEKINGIVRNETDGHIQEAIFRDDLLKAQLILITGLYFKASWKHKFNSTDTKRDKFFDSEGNHIGYVDMMYQRNNVAFNAIKELGCYALEMEYAELPVTSRNDFTSGLSMIILLPKKGQTLAETVFKLYSYSLAKLYRDLYTAKVDYADDEVEVFLPKFEIDSDFDIQPILKSFGITEIFDQSKANLSHINPNYYVSAMIHKAKMNVDESGTVASSTTSAIFANKSTPSKFMANKPFIFFIVDKHSNLILFCGQYTTPAYPLQ